MNITKKPPTSKFEINGRTPERGDAAVEVKYDRENTVDVSFNIFSATNNAIDAKRNKNNADTKIDDASLAQQASPAFIDTSITVTNAAQPTEQFNIVNNNLDDIRLVLSKLHDNDQ